jgi:Uma2 family endonuclease
MATTRRHLTVDDLDPLSEVHEGERHELIDGLLFVTPVSALKHQIVSLNLIRALDRHVDGEKLGMLFAPPTGVRLSADTLVVPDLLFVAKDHLPDPSAWMIEVAPDLVAEILSPGTRRRDLRTKRELYAQFGVREYWIVDPDAKSVEILTIDDGRYEQALPGEDGALGSHVLPGLVLTLAQVFDGIG